MFHPFGMENGLRAPLRNASHYSSLLNRFLKPLKTFENAFGFWSRKLRFLQLPTLKMAGFAILRQIPMKTKQGEEKVLKE